MTQHGGHVSAYSELGHGTTFKLYFPLGEGKVTQARRAPPKRHRGEGTILVVEDEVGVLSLVASVLRGCGYDVLTASQPTQALETAAKHQGKIDLLFTDVIMPEMNGRELADVLLESRPSMRVLFTSGYTDNVVLDHGVTSQAAFIEKPTTPDALSRKVREVLQ
jgi:CheY-like chemotaxis protein